MSDGISREPDLSDPAQAHAHRITKALEREYRDDKQVPRWVIAVESPPFGRVGVASTGDDEADTMRLIQLGYYAFRAGMRKKGLPLPPKLGDDHGALRQMIGRWLDEVDPDGMVGARELELLGEKLYEFWRLGQPDAQP